MADSTAVVETGQTAEAQSAEAAAQTAARTAATVQPEAGAQAEQLAPADGEPTDRDELRFTQRQLDHVITQRLHEERARVSKEFDAFKGEVAPQLEEASRLRQEREQAERDKQTEAEKLQAEVAARDTLLAEKDAQLATHQAALQEVAVTRRRETIDAAINAVAPTMLTVQRDQLHRQFAGITELDPAQVTQAAQAAQAEVQAMLQAHGILPQGTQIGSPGSPPAEPQSTAYEQYEAQLLELANRAEAGDDEAAQQFHVLKAQRPRT